MASKKKHSDNTRVPSLCMSVSAWRIPSRKYSQSTAVYMSKIRYRLKGYNVHQHLLNASSVTIRGAECRLWGKTRMLVPPLRLAQ
jgi:hypothetical protein